MSKSNLSALAGQKVPKGQLENIPKLISAYYTLAPDIEQTEQRVAFGTSGHRGSAYKKSFNEAHVKAISQAICDYRNAKGIDGTLFIGKDTHALSTPAQLTAIEVFAANKVSICIAKDDGYTPTPLVSFAIIEANKKGGSICDGIVITPSHNPPADGGYKYNPPNGGPADTDVTSQIEKRANEILENGLKEVKLCTLKEAMRSGYITAYDFMTPYVAALKEIIDMDAIKKAGLRIGVNPLGGASIAVYQKINEMYGIGMDILDPYVDPTFSFMHLDHDGKIRMDCSSPYAMAGLIELKDRYDIAFANDVDSDRHGIVTPKGGLMNPNHYLSVAIWYLYTSRKNWREDLKIGKTLVSSSMIDRVAQSLNKTVYEVPVGFKWFAAGLMDGEIGFGGEESAGASFLRFDGSVWTTDKDGIILNLLAAEILAKEKKDPALIYAGFEQKFGKAYYERIDAPASKAEKEKLKNIKPHDIHQDILAGEKIKCIYAKAPGNDADIGGVKIVTENGWVALRPSGTEDIYKIYAESFLSPEHLKALQKEAKEIVDAITN
ncbi:MAG: phosphoglucomutase [Epsilonproteobacteria bacterium (ex Lamellibrachia satsuma)]|nr:MAG: phosphoglucomutase [Epsilonproteobacteria bacterium (ex Lamellibrachia satsuma)]